MFCMEFKFYWTWLEVCYTTCSYELPLVDETAVEMIVWELLMEFEH